MLGTFHPCPEGHFPATCCFEPTPGGFVVTLCGLYSAQWDVVEHAARGFESRERARPRVAFDAATGWRSLDPVSPSARCSRPPRPGGAWPEGCPEALAAALPPLSDREFRRLRPGSDGEGAGKQDVGGCVEHGGYVWFGLAFYDGEGITGVGGIGRFDPQSKKLEIRRPRLLRGWSSAPLLHDGRWLWLATYRFAEGGDEPAIGVVRYDWTRDRLVPEVNAMCGFLATGMKKAGDALWLANDGGLSRRDASGRWEHFVFRVGEATAIAKTTCADVYDLARSTVAKDDHAFEGDLRGFLRMRERERALRRR